MSAERFVVSDELEWAIVARAVLNLFLRESNRVNGLLIGLRGDMGVGKTSFVRAVARELGVPAGEVASPTYSLQHVYSLPQGLSQYGVQRLSHWDLYRLKEAPEELTAESPQAGELILVEWPERCNLTTDWEIEIIMTSAGTRDVVLST